MRNLSQRHLRPYALARAWRAACLQERFTIDDAKSAREVFLLAGDTHGFAITTLDGTVIGDGKPGPVFTALKRLLGEDAANPAEGDEEHEAVGL